MKLIIKYVHPPNQTDGRKVDMITAELISMPEMMGSDILSMEIMLNSHSKGRFHITVEE